MLHFDECVKAFVFNGKKSCFFSVMPINSHNRGFPLQCLMFTGYTH